MVNWERFFDHKDRNAQVITFNESILHVFRNYLIKKYITINDKDPVPMKEAVKSRIKVKNEFFKQYIQNCRSERNFVFLETLIIELNELITSTKSLCYENLAKKLNNPVISKKVLVYY